MKQKPLKKKYYIMKNTKFFVFLLSGGALFATSCEQKTPAEKNAEEVGEAIENVGDSVEDAADSLGDSIKDASKQ